MSELIYKIDNDTLSITDGSHLLVCKINIKEQTCIINAYSEGQLILTTEKILLDEEEIFSFYDVFWTITTKLLTKYIANNFHKFWQSLNNYKIEN